MTKLSREELKLLLPIMQAFVEGKEVQVKDPYKIDGKWVDTPNPSWDRDLAYRIKPEVLKVESYAVVLADTGTVVALYYSERDANLYISNCTINHKNWAVIKLEGTYER